MTVYISKKANLKFNIGVRWEDAVRFLTCAIAALALIALGLIVACIAVGSSVTRVTLEAGEYLSPALILGEGAEFCPDYDKDCVNHAGVYYFTVKRGDESRRVRLKVKDTQPPRVTLRDVSFAVNSKDGEDYYPSPLDFIESVYEPDGLMGEYVSELPELDRLGEYEARVRYFDASGNRTAVYTVKMTQVVDNEPPTVDVSPYIVCEVGRAVEYKPYITITDNCAGTLTFDVDDSSLDLFVAGEYTVYITGIDRVGNKSERAAVTLKVVDGFNTDGLDSMLRALVSEISPEGKSREEICREIYRVVRRELVYTGGSEKGDIARAAYMALLGGGGDCYSYFALSTLLLEACGIESMPIERIGGTEGEHYWSLVNIGEADAPRWYHFDTTELRADKYDHSGCLLTDRQTEAYSKAREGFYRYDKSGYPTVAEEIITPTPRLEVLY